MFGHMIGHVTVALVPVKSTLARIDRQLLREHTLLICNLYNSMFQEHEFETACKELETRDLEGWEFFTESHDVEIYRQYHEVCKL